MEVVVVVVGFQFWYRGGVVWDHFCGFFGACFVALLRVVCWVFDDWCDCCWCVRDGVCVVR